MEAMQKAKGSIRVALGKCPEPLAKEHRLQNKEHQSENHPDKRHEVEPPERRILVPSPRSEPLEQVEPSESGHKRDHASLSRETALDGLKKPQALITGGYPAKCRNDDGSNESDPAYPEYDAHDMENSGYDQQTRACEDSTPIDRGRVLTGGV